MKPTISKENLLSICGQNQRSQQACNLGYTRSIMEKIMEGEPLLHQFILSTAQSTAEEFANRENDPVLEDARNEAEEQITESQLLSVMFAHCMAMVANAFICRDEAKELEDSIG
jgi:hypothetical protein